MSADKKALKDQEQLRFNIQQRQKIESQVNEIMMAKDEIDLLETGAEVYKLVGPLMVPQELGEVKLTVGSRLNYLKERMDYYEKEIQALCPPKKEK